MPWVLRRLNWDLVAGQLSLWIIATYTATYGIWHIGGLVTDGFSLAYLVILLPIWIIDGLKSSFEALVPREYKNAREDLTKVTVVIACKDGEEVIGKTLRSLLRKFHPEQIIVSSNGSTDRTCDIVRDYGAICLDFREGLGKVRAINAALPYVKTPYVLLLDDDTLLAGATIPTGLLDAGCDAVAFRVFVSIETWVTKLQAHEYRKSCDIGRRFHNKHASVQNISGAIGLFKRDILLQQIKQHTGEFSGEDLQRTLLIHLSSLKGRGGVVLARSIVITQAPLTVRALFNQRVFGWFPGLYANFGNMVKIMRNRDLSPALRYDSFHNLVLVSLLDIVRVLSLPIMVFYPGYFIVLYVAYVVIEYVPYHRSYRTEPLWVILVYPLYGMFGLLTRACAFAAFLYRRIAAKLSHARWRDDYRNAPVRIKVLSTIMALALFATPFILNLVLNYSAIFTDTSMWLPGHLRP